MKVRFTAAQAILKGNKVRGQAINTYLKVLLKHMEVRYGLKTTLMVSELHLPLASQPIKLLK